MATTALANTFKQEVLMGAHCFAATVTPTGTCASGTVVSSLSAMTGIAVGMGVSGTNIASGTFVAAMSASTITLSKAVTGAISGGTLTISGDQFYLALIIGTPTVSGGWGAAATNYGTGSGSPTNANLGTDEVASGNGYTTGGFPMVNQSPTVSSATGILTFATNPTWSSATFATSAGMLYNATSRLAGSVGRVVGIYDLGGVQTVSAGTLVLAAPTYDATHALVRIGP